MDSRLLYKKIFDFLKPTPQMIFISGPRQSGKTTFIKNQMSEFHSANYLNWDIDDDRKNILLNTIDTLVDHWPQTKPLLIFDEIHKYSEWKNFLKGVYDKNKNDLKIAVTGSGRLDFYQKGKDSLAGRYFLFHMWPLTIAEFETKKPSFADFVKSPLLLDEYNHLNDDIWNQLTVCSGFPDPFFSANEKLYRVWSSTYKNQLVREEIRQLTRIEKIDLIEKLTLLLPHKVGGPLSIDNLASDLQVAFDSVKKWLLVLERFYICFRIAPWSKKISRTITKEQKLYLFDYAQIQDPAAKFENMVALELLRAAHNWREQGEGAWELYYIRDRDKREVDFLLTKDQKPFLLVEAKMGDTTPSDSLKYFQDRLAIPAIQLVSKPKFRKYIKNDRYDILVCTASDWLGCLN